MVSRGLSFVVVTSALALALTACGNGSGGKVETQATRAAPTASAPDAAALAAVSKCATKAPKPSTIGLIVASSMPVSAAYCTFDVSTDRPTTWDDGVALPPVRTLAMLLNTGTNGGYEPPYCPGDDEPETLERDSGILLTYKSGEQRFVALQPGNCAAVLEEENPVYLLPADLTWLVETADLDWLGKDGKIETAPPAPTICRPKAPKPRALAPVLAKGTPVEAAACSYGNVDFETLLDPKATVAKLRAAQQAKPDPELACTMEADGPSWIVLVYRDGSRAHVYVDTSGCWSIVQKQSRKILTDPDERRLVLNDSSILG